MASWCGCLVSSRAGSFLETFIQEIPSVPKPTFWNVPEHFRWQGMSPVVAFFMCIHLSQPLHHQGFSPSSPL